MQKSTHIFLFECNAIFFLSAKMLYITNRFQAHIGERKCNNQIRIIPSIVTQSVNNILHHSENRCNTCNIDPITKRIEKITPISSKDCIAECVLYLRTLMLRPRNQ